MSEENVEWIERFWDLYNRREIDAWVAMMAPDLEWHVDPEDPDTTVHRGPEAARRYGLSWAEMMDAKIEVLEVFEGEDQIVAWTRLKARGGSSSVPVVGEWAFIFKLRDGFVTRIQETQDKREALEVAGVLE